VKSENTHGSSTTFAESPIRLYRELVNGRIPGVSDYSVPGGINFSMNCCQAIFSISEPVFKLSRTLVAGDPASKR